MPALDAAGGDRAVGDVVLRTPGLEGQAELRAPVRPGQRGPAGITRRNMERALESTDLRSFRTVEITAKRVGKSGTAVRNRGGTDTEYIELEAPDAGPDFGQVLLYQDEAGVLTWHLGEPVKGAAERGAGRRRYRVWGGVAKGKQDEKGTRGGLLSAIGRKVLTVVVFPLVDPLLGRVGDHFAERWETKNRPYGLRIFGPAGYNKPSTAEWTGADWKHVADGRALLFVHGTGSRSHSGFGALPSPFVKWLHTTYQGRVFAIDHPTIGSTPTENVEWLVNQVPGGTKLELDVICHSRGGLVSRVLTEQQGALRLGDRQLNVRKLLMIGVPNAGTALADGDHLVSFVDSYTTILNLLPAPAVVDVLETVITVMKQLAVGAFRGLDGIQSMLPKGEYLRGLNVALNAPIATQYYAMGSNFEPSQKGFGQFKDGIIDKIFAADNDGIVPTVGVAAKNGSSKFPVLDSHVFQGEIDHSGYFRNKEAVGMMKDWLSA